MYSMFFLPKQKLFAFPFALVKEIIIFKNFQPWNLLKADDK